MIGKRVYYINQMKKAVYSGILYSQSIAETGYIMNIIRVIRGGKKISERVEDALTFSEKELAYEKLEKIKPLIDKAIELTDKYNEKIKVLREKIIGKPNKSFMEE